MRMFIMFFMSTILSNALVHIHESIHSLLYMSRLLESIALVEISITFQSFKLNAHLLVCLVDNGIFTIFWWWFAASLTHIGAGVC